MVSRTPKDRSRDARQALRYIAGSALFATAEQLLALEADLLRLQPRLKLKPIKLENQVLLVTAPSAGVASRLRQFEPSLLAGLRARGWLVGRVRFRAATVFDPPPPAPRPQKARVSDRTLADLEQLRVEQLDPAAGATPLGQAIAEFIRRQQGYDATGR
jgi:hypothetical protein